MQTSREDVAKLYGKIVEYEDSRLATHPMERELTLRAIREGLASSGTAETPRKRIADVGGGPGKLAFALADEGHHVDLVDITPELIHLAGAEQARRSSAGREQALLASISVGDALNGTALPDGSYHAVLLLGPLYHLLEETERKQTVENALRLCRRGEGLVFCAFVSMEAHLRDIAQRDPERLVEKNEFYTKYVCPWHHASLDMLTPSLVL